MSAIAASAGLPVLPHVRVVLVEAAEVLQLHRGRPLVRTAEPISRDGIVPYDGLSGADSWSARRSAASSADETRGSLVSAAVVFVTVIRE